jgi:hypothetical protein
MDQLKDEIDNKVKEVNTNQELTSDDLTFLLLLKLMEEGI